MYNRKYMLGIVCLIFLFAITFVSAVKPITSVSVNEGFSIQPTEKSAIRQGVDHEFEVHVFNISNGMPITSGITCYMHLYQEDGNHVYEGVDTTAGHIFDYSFNLNGTNFTKLGEYQAKFQCNNSRLGGGTEIFFVVNNFGEELDTAHSIKFNSAMLFMMILFVMALVGLFKIDNYIGKFVLYWICHVIFIVGTFSMWQFNWGYTISYLGMAGFWKVLFYVSTIAVFPMLLLSLAWIFYIHTFNEHMQKLINKGEKPETAFAMANKKSGGWFNGG